MLENTDFNKSEQYTLSIRLATDGFSFSIFNPLSDEILSIVDYNIDGSLSLTANLKQAFASIEWLSYTYRRVNVIVVGKRYTLLPLEFFEDEDIETVFYHNHSKRENEFVSYNILLRNGVVVLFGMDKSAHDFLYERYPETRFYVQTTPLIEYYSVKSRLGNNCKLYAHRRKNAVDVFVFDCGRLRLANSYTCNEVNDCIYYLLYVWKQLGMEQERDELHLSGQLQAKEYLLSELRRFVRRVFVMNPCENLDLRAISLCE